MELIFSPIFWGCMLPTTAAAYTDWKEYRLPNYLTLPVLILGLGYSLYSGNWSDSLLGAGLGLLIGIVSFLLGQMGMGDAKLMAAFGAWLGPYGFLFVFFIACWLGAIWGVYKYVRAGKLKECFLKWNRLPDDPDAPLPAGAVAFGCCLVAGLWIFIFINLWAKEVMLGL